MILKILKINKDALGVKTPVASLFIYIYIINYLCLRGNLKMNFVNIVDKQYYYYF